MLPVTTTPRSSKRKSAQLVSSRIRKQLWVQRGRHRDRPFKPTSRTIIIMMTVCLIRNLLDNQLDLISDGEDEDEFVPSKKELQSSSEDDDDDGEEEVGLDSDEEVVSKKGRHAAAGSHTPRSKQRTRSSARTPRKTPNKKVKVLETSEKPSSLFYLFFSHLVSCFHRSHPVRHALLITPLPASPAGSGRPDSLLMFWRRPERGETQQSVTSDPYFYIY